MPTSNFLRLKVNSQLDFPFNSIVCDWGSLALFSSGGFSTRNCARQDNEVGTRARSLRVCQRIATKWLTWFTAKDKGSFIFRCLNQLNHRACRWRVADSNAIQHWVPQQMRGDVLAGFLALWDSKQEVVDTNPTQELLLRFYRRGSGKHWAYGPYLFTQLSLHNPEMWKRHAAAAKF